MPILDDLKWRYSTKKYLNKAISDENIFIILESIRLSATSLGIQPFKVFIVEDKSVREHLKIASLNQSQITEASHVLVFAAWTHIDDQMVDAYIHLIAKTRNEELVSLQSFKNMIIQFVKEKNSSEILEWTSKQTYIALGKAMLCAASLRIDATPMEGFDSQKVDTLLNFDAQGLHSSVILALGYRDATKDKLSHKAKVRRPASEFFESI
ncbi:MAG: NAD(P)H-dependent oxidoreductase [Flavobacteriales bacterium]|nr:MAG: NAD(P)H-dependent oxidoreductase [Flavobacteriales bacterium]